MSAIKEHYHDLINAQQNGRVLIVNLTHYWFDQYLKGDKKEEYRLVTEYWERRLLKHYNGSFEEPVFRDYEYIDLRRGYTSTRLVYELKNISIKKPNPEWAPKDWWDIKVFAIEVGNLIYKDGKFFHN